MSGLHVARRLLYRVGAVACFSYGAWSWLHGPRPRLPLGPEDVRRILLIRLDLLGDVVFSLPAIEALAVAFPSASIDVLALPYTAPILSGIAAVADVHVLDTNSYRRPQGWLRTRDLLDTIQVLRARRYDLAVGMSGLMGGVFAVLSGAPWRLGYRDETYRGAYNIPVAGRRYRRPQHEVDYALDLVGALRVTTAVPPDAIAIVGPGVSAPSVTGAFDTGAGRERVTSRSTSVMTRPVLRPPRSSSRPLPPQPYAVLVPGASNGAAKRWPPVYWSQLGDRLARECGLGVVLSGSAGERALAATVDRGMQTRAMNLAGETSVEELTALLAGAAVVVAGDTGPVHLAAALDRPVVGIYGPTDPTNTGPRSPLGVALRLGLTCSPCYDLRTPADCKLPDQSTPCMWGLQPAQVFDAVAALLREAA